MKTLILLVLLVFISSLTTFGQIGIDNVSPDPSSVLDLSSTEGGLLVPRMTTQEREAIVSPANSLLVFDTSVNKYFYYDNNKWSPVSPWSASVSGTDVYYETGNVGIGTASPQYKLDVDGPVNATALHINGTPFPTANFHHLSNGPLAKTATGDWNNYTETGFYMGNNMTNASPGSTHQWRYVTVIRHNESYCIQYSSDFRNDAYSIRAYNAGNWTAWKRVITNENDLSAITDMVRVYRNELQIYGRRAVLSWSDQSQNKELHINYGQDHAGGTRIHGNLIVSGSITENSDIRLKDNIKPIENALEKVKQIEGVTFTRKDLPDTERKHIGLIADDLLNIVPELVHVPESEEEMKSVDYSSMVALLVEAIKEQQTQIEDLKQEIESMKRE